jgi:hypothetical protein
MIQLYEQFKDDSKFILTESRFKVLLFYELQIKRVRSVCCSIHTYYADNYINKEIVVRKLKFRDLSP